MNKRIGNDLTFTWKISRKNESSVVPENFNGKDVEVILLTPSKKQAKVDDITINTGVISFVFKGKNQIELGQYIAVLSENKGDDNMVTVDTINAVTLVPHSYMEKDGDDGDVIEVQAVELTSTISAGGGGGGFVQQQADWAQTDNTAVDYIKNKPTLASVATSGSYNDLSDKPDLSSFITRSVDDLMNYYLKSETYTKAEVQQLISAIQQFHYEVYATLPQTGASNVLYLIGPTGTGTDKYEEYVYANNDWTKIGDTSIDLSGYVTTQALNTALTDYVTSSALSTALAGKEDITPIEAVASGTTAITAEVNKYYEVAGTVSSLTVTLPTPTANTEVTMVVVHLTIGNNPLIVVTSVNEVVKFSAAYSVVANKEYELSCLYNGSKWIVSSMEVAV